MHDQASPLEASGTVHGIYVFALLAQFWRQVGNKVFTVDNQRFAEGRIHEIGSQICHLADFARSPDLTDCGHKLVEGLLELGTTPV